MNAQPLLSVRDMTRTWDGVHGCRNVSFDPVSYTHLTLPTSDLV